MKLSFTIGGREFSIGRSPALPRKSSVRLVRGFDAAKMSRLTQDWLMPQTSADAEIYTAIRSLRGRSRELERNNEYAQGYGSLIENNVLGANGIALEMKVMESSGVMDTLANETVKKGWKDWSRREFCTMAGTLCWREVEGQSLRRTLFDGGIIIREIFGAPNPYNYSLELIEIDCLDTDYNTRLSSGNEVRFGVELDAWKKPVAYYLWTVHPGDSLPVVPKTKKRQRFTAEEMFHLFWQERPQQTIGIPWMTSVMQALEHLGKYREAELVAARVSACKGYAIEQEFPSNEFQYPIDENGDPREEMQPGMGLLLDPGQKYHDISPNHPNTAFGDFVKSTLRGAAAGLRINYNSLANDLESVNYSSMRAGKLEEVEEYMSVQNWLIENLHARVFPHWLSSALVSGALKMPNGSSLPVAKYAKFNAPDWKPRRWPWVDPQKDLNAAIMAINNRLKSRRQVIAEMGGDIAVVDQEQEEDGDMEFVEKQAKGFQPDAALTDDEKEKTDGKDNRE